MSATTRTAETWHRVRPLRARGLTQRAIARRLGVGVETVRWAARTEVPPPARPPLSDLALRVLRLAAAGHTERQIAQIVGRAKPTVHDYLVGAQRKLGASSRVETFARARRQGLLNDDQETRAAA